MIGLKKNMKKSVEYYHEFFNKKIQGYNLFKIFYYEYYSGDYESWKDLITKKDLGIHFIYWSRKIKAYRYKIVDERKWFLAKLKYGI